MRLFEITQVFSEKHWKWEIYIIWPPTNLPPQSPDLRHIKLSKCLKLAFKSPFIWFGQMCRGTRTLSFVRETTLAFVLQTCFVFTLIHMTSGPRGTNLVKVNLFFLVSDRNRSIFFCLQSASICFSSDRSQMESPDGVPQGSILTPIRFYLYTLSLIATYLYKIILHHFSFGISP